MPTIETKKTNRRSNLNRPLNSVEQLEKRELFAVGSTFIPAVDNTFDGVVEVQRSDGNMQWIPAHFTATYPYRCSLCRFRRGL